MEIQQVGNESGVITGLIPLDQKKKKVFIDQDYFCILYSGEIRRLHIYEGAVLNKRMMQDIMEKIVFPRAKNYVMHLLEARELTVYQVRTKLEDHHYPEEAVSFAIGYWSDLGYLNDQNYALEYIRCHYEKQSCGKINMTLKRRGISNELIEMGWSALEEDLGDCEQKQAQALQAMIEKLSRGMDLTDRSTQDKLTRKLLYRGFSYGEIRKGIEAFQLEQN